MTYYLISYSHSRGFGNIFFHADPYLDIRAAEKEIADGIGDDKIVIITINRIRKEQFVKAKSNKGAE